MIVVRAPLRISFVGGGTDLPGFYKKYRGKVISTAIDKYVYVVINKTPLINKIAARYSISELVDRPRQLQHTRIRAALMDVGIRKGIEIATFASLPSRTGLGSSSSFAVALMKGLTAYTGKKLTKAQAAEAACRLEIDLLKEPIGKQDQYAASFGGFNILQFNTDDSVTIEPILLDYKERANFEKHILLFFTGLTRDASSVLRKQKANISKNISTLKSMSDSVDEFSSKILGGDYAGMGQMLHEGWVRKKSLTPLISSLLIDDLYAAGLTAGAWGGKILGAGGGGCILFLTPPMKRNNIRKSLASLARKNNLKDFQELPVKFVQSGAEILLNEDFI